MGLCSIRSRTAWSKFSLGSWGMRLTKTQTRADAKVEGVIKVGMGGPPVRPYWAPHHSERIHLRRSFGGQAAPGRASLPSGFLCVAALQRASFPHVPRDLLPLLLAQGP